MPKLTDDQRAAIRDAAQKKRSTATAQQRAREAYEQKLTAVIYSATQANREAHFESKGRVPLAAPDDIRKAAIEGLAAEGVVDSDAPSNKRQNADSTSEDGRAFASAATGAEGAATTDETQNS